MKRKKASDFDQGLLNLFDLYVHGGVSRRQFLDRAKVFAVGGMTAAGLLEALSPKYAEALPWCITLDNSKGISRLRFWCKNSRVNGINDLPVFMHQGSAYGEPESPTSPPTRPVVHSRDLVVGASCREMIS